MTAISDTEIRSWFANASRRCQYHRSAIRIGFCRYTNTRCCRPSTCPFIIAITTQKTEIQWKQTQKTQQSE